jgi:hypothetical protein
MRAHQKSEPFARITVADRRHEEGDRQGDHQDVHHRLLLFGADGIAVAKAYSPILFGAELPFSA